MSIGCYPYVIRRNTSPTPIGQTPGDLSKGIN